MNVTRLREAIAALMDATRAECRDGPHAPVEEAQEAVEAAMAEVSKANDPHFYQLTDGSFAPYPHGMTEDEWNAQIGDPSYEHAKDLPND